MGSAPSPPSPPDPVATASAQTGTNVNTAIANAALAHTNQTDASGNTLTWNQTGTTQMKAQDGSSYDLPTWSGQQKYSAPNQAIYDTNQQTQQNMATIGRDESQKIGGLLSTPIDLSAANINKYTNTNYQQGFDRQWNLQQNSLEQKLADQGITLGSEAYNTAHQNFTTQRQSAEDQYLGDMYNNAQQAITSQRNQPINELTALMSGSQVSQPSFTNAPTTQMPTVDYAGIVNQNYQNQMSAYNAQQANSSATMGGIFGLGGSVLGGLLKGPALFSDRRLKTCIRELYQLANGLTVYSFRYLWGLRDTVGLMADDVMRHCPDAVRISQDGFARVDYERALSHGV